MVQWVKAVTILDSENFKLLEKVKIEIENTKPFSDRSKAELREKAFRTEHVYQIQKNFR